MKRLFNKAINIIIIIFLIFYCLIWSLSSIIIKEVINTNALPAGFSLTPESNIRYNPFTSHLTINNLAIKPRKQKVTLKLNSLEAELHLHQLLFNTLYISEFTLDGLYIPAAIEGSNITIAGITSNSTAENTADSEEDVLSDDKKAFALNVIVPKVKLTNIVFDIKHLDTSHHLVLDTLLLDNILFSQDKQNINLRLKSKINEAPLDIDIHTQLFQQLGIVNVEVSLDDFSLNYAQPFMPEMITELNAEVNYSSKFNIVLSKQKTQIDFKSFLLTINKLHAKQNDLLVDVTEHKLQSDDIAIILQPNSKTNISGTLTSVINHVALESSVDDSKVNIERIAVNDLSIALAQDGSKTQLNMVNLLLAINNVNAKQNGLLVDVTEHKLQSDDIEIILQPNSKTNISGTLTSVINHVALESSVDDSQINVEQIAVNDLSIALAQDESKTQFNISNILLAISNVHVKQNDLSVDVANQDIQSNDIAVVLLPNNTTNIAAKLHSTTKNILIASLDNNSQLAVIEGVDIKDISLLFVDNTPKVTVAKVDVNNSVFSQFNNKKLPALASFKQLSVNSLEYEHKVNKLSVENITLAGAVANILLDKNKQLSTLTTLNSNIASSSKVDAAVTDEEIKAEAPNVVKAESEVKAEIDTDPKIAFRLGSFKLLNGADIKFKDKSVLPHYESNIHIDVLSLSTIDTTKPDIASILNLQANSDKYESFAIDASMLPFALEQKFTIDALIKEVSLPSVSSYAKEALQFEIKSGQLDLTVKASLKGNNIDGDADVLLRGIEFASVDGPETDEVANKSSIPFNIALGMLKDSKGNVDLSLPLSGDISSPSFGLTGLFTLLVKQATMSAAKHYLISTFLPYSNVIKVAMVAGEHVLKLRVNDLNYLPQQVDLTAEQSEFSRQLSLMLEERSDINVKLCAFTIPEDIGLVNVEKELIEDNIKRLHEISTQRVNIFKNHMVEKLKVSSAKLLLCTPQVDTSKDAKPRIEFVI